MPSRDFLDYAIHISDYHKNLKIGGSKRKIRNNLQSSFQNIIKNYQYIEREVKHKREVISVAEWLMDNIYLIEKEYKDIKESTKEVKYKNIPVIDEGKFKGYPRVYHICFEMLMKTENKVDESLIMEFIDEYQKHFILTDNELWLIPKMLRVVLIRSIGELSKKIAEVQMEKTKADILGNNLLRAESNKNKEEIKKLLSQEIKFTPHFTERLLKILRDNSVENKSIYKWINNNLDNMSTNDEDIIIIEHKIQSKLKLLMGNCINSIRIVEALNWQECFEKLSYVEKVLRKDPAKVYEAMDFESKAYYRHNIEKMARKMSLSEAYVAKMAIECAKEASKNYKLKCEEHVGYYIIDNGVQCLEDKIKYRKKGIKALIKSFQKHKFFWYAMSNILGTILLSVAIIYTNLLNDKNIVIWRYVISLIAIIIPISEIINSIFNWSINHLTSTKFVPRMDLYNGIPSNCKTVVVVPAILNNVCRADEIINELEVYYLANREKNLYFVLLGDFKDSAAEEEAQDSDINKAALSHIKTLNEKYSKGNEEIFYYLNRKRVYNKSQKAWIGFERKRGKLMEFNALLRGKEESTFNVISGNIKELQAVKYVITLDADTKLPIGVAKKLIGAMEHVLNRPCLDEEGKVSRGYGIMQPKVSISTLSSQRTFHSKIFSGETGIDTYSTAVSDVYQDLFGEGIYTGKGIYDIDVFQSAIGDRIRENSVLSHDLLEGAYARCALISDVELIDGYPAYYDASSKRLHRWVRGDWQLIPYILKDKKINRLSRWKMIDNLRRSLISPSIILLIIVSLSIAPDGFEQWITVVFISLIFPWLFDVSEAVVSPIRGVSLSGRMKSNKDIIIQIFLIYSFLTFNAYFMLDAITRSIYRIIISKRNLLQWQTAYDVEGDRNTALKAYISVMWQGSIIALIIEALAFYRSIGVGIVFIPSCVLWFFSPIIAFFISKDKNKENIKATYDEKVLIRRMGRKTFAYFEDFIKEEDNFLPPDNYQEDPPKGIAHRTSPTNMGMGLTSNVVAYDLGYITIKEFIFRLNKTLENMESLEKLEGHFYNWYDTKSKIPLPPKYISTVDSGNLLGYIWLTIKAIEDYMSKPLLNGAYVEGICDTLRIASEEINSKLDISNYYNSAITELEAAKLDVIELKKVLKDIQGQCDKVKNNAEGYGLYWNNKLENQLKNRVMELEGFFPWEKTVSNREDMLINKAKDIKDLGDKTSINQVPIKIDEIIKTIKVSKDALSEDNKWITELKENLNKNKLEFEKLIEKLENLKLRLKKMEEEMNFSIVYDKKRQLFSIGYDVDSGNLSNSYYDLLASESRQASFIAIAKGAVDKNHWFRLGRAMTYMGRGKGLVSWSGTMFEYFMPMLIMKDYPDTILDETYRSVINGQKKYSKTRKIPIWGISEAAFYSFDVASNYQYKAFGVPGIGLKRGLVDELVVSPYATILAMQRDFKGSINNLKNIISNGLEGKYGLYEAIDYTKSRLPKDLNSSIVKCFMVHHEGMELMAIDNILNSFILQNRFHSIPEVKSAELLLQERIPRRVTYDRKQTFEIQEIQDERAEFIVRHYSTAKTEMPETIMLSNSKYSMMISNSGSGYGKLNDMTAYRWREDGTLDDLGMYFYFKDIETNKVWGATYEPTKTSGKNYEVIFALDKAEFKREDFNILTHSEICVAEEDNSEIRVMTLKNNEDIDRVIEVTSYSEVTLSPMNADEVHPAFSNLFIRTEFVEMPFCILASRRPRAKNQNKPWLMQTMIVHGEAIGGFEYETSRINFIGRGKDISAPAAMEKDSNLRNTVGNVIDPIISIRRRFHIKPKGSIKIYYISSICESREEAMAIAEKYNEAEAIKRAFNMSWSQSQLELNFMGIKANQANLYQLMASKIVFLNTMVRDREGYIKNLKKSQSALWAYGISGDLPIVLLLVRSEADLGLVHQLLNAHEYWNKKGLKADLVILNREENSYIQEFNNSLRDTLLGTSARDKLNKSGGVFLYSIATMAEEDVKLIMAIARFTVDSSKGLLVSQVKSSINAINNRAILNSKKIKYNVSKFEFPVQELKYFNGYGGFDTKNSEYVIKLKDNKNTPAPWINVISNEGFGFHVSELGSAYTWSKNSREFKLTPWSNDYVTDRIGEALYIRDEESGKVWSITPKPVRDNGEYIISHGKGYSSFKHIASGIAGEITMFVPINESLKIITVKLKNISNIKRKLSLTYYAELVLGVVSRHTRGHIVTNINKDIGFIYGNNAYSENFKDNFVYLKIQGGIEESFSGDRKEFLGRGGSTDLPEAMLREGLSNNVGAGMDSCLAENSKLYLEENSEKTINIILGEGQSREEIYKAIEKYSNKDSVTLELQQTKNYWSEMLEKIQVKTPDEAMNIMLNGQLMYQAIACRLWARSAFYQSGGAYGFRDQLQDVMPLCFIKPEMTRKQIITSASRQFLEGDVQHWWHPVINSGIRTRFSDDLLWLPYVVSYYIKSTGDYDILEEKVEYLEEEPLREGEDERYNIAKKSEKYGTIYEHCIKTLEKGLKFGVHNILLMGSGDWNDGMSTVGNKGRGESVWLGWFVYTILKDFSEICSYKGDQYREHRFNELSKFISENIEKNAWDGEWYRRAYFDDGTPLGSSKNDECKIDSIAQSWAVISKAGNLKRARLAMNSLEKYLVKEDKGMILLLSPPFNNSKLEPGYIKGYIPGVRENGGQYTHAATWVILAMTKLGENNKAWKLFNMINPINHTKTKEEIDIYKVEPYVMAADVYAESSNVGRGGWTWYTGAAGWMYRVGIENILGLRLSGGKGFEIHPCIPDAWKEYEIQYKHDKCVYNIKITRTNKISVELDGEKLNSRMIPFFTEGEHIVHVTI